MGDSGADTLRDSIESGWGFTSTERISKTATASMKETVQFFAHSQLAGAGEYSKAVEVKKILDPAVPDDENVEQHARWARLTHKFDVTCRYRILSIEEVLWDQAEQDIEDMCKEVVRIIKTVYDPTAGTGSFFATNYEWRNEDNHTTTQQEAKRVLSFTLTEIKSQSTETFTGYGGVFTFDQSASTADSKPVSDYIYTEAHHVRITEGSPQTSIMTRLSSAGTGAPVKFRGKFLGTLTATIYAKKSDLDETTIDSLYNIYKAQAAGELATAVFLHANTNTESAAKTLTTTTTVNVTNLEKISDDDQLLVFNVTGDITKPTTEAIA